MNEIIKDILLIVPICVAAFSAVWGVITYSRQQRNVQLQNLISVFQRFSNNDDFIAIFKLGDDCYVKLEQGLDQNDIPQLQKLEEIPAELKFKYLALLEEVAILAKRSAVDKENALHLFKFHFFYVYGNPPISNSFWANVGGGDAEREEEGWDYQNDFAKECINRINASIQNPQ